jgi:Flp pilus assembly protein TadB
VEKRYIMQTFLSERLTVQDFLLLMLLWCIMIVILFCVLGIVNILGFTMMILSLATPLLLLEKYIERVDLSIDKGIFNLLTQINARMLKSEDILRALQEAEHTINNKHIIKIISVFNRTIKLGLPPTQAFSRLQIVTRNEYLRYLFTNIEIVYLRRGNVHELMRALENEYTSIQIEINKRKVALEHEKNMTLFSLSLVVLTTIKIIKDNDYILTFYRANSFLTAVLALFVIIGMGFVLKASFTKY